MPNGSQVLTLFDMLLVGGWLAGKKTFLVSVGLIVVGVIDYLVGNTGLKEAVLVILNGLGLGSLRAAVERLSSKS